MNNTQTSIRKHFIESLSKMQNNKNLLTEKTPDLRFFPNKYKILPILLVLSLLLGFLSPQPVQAATLMVTNLNDSGPGSLRQAITDAADGDTIMFSTIGTITLTSGQLVVNKSLTIMGPEYMGQIIISGNNSSRVFYFSSMWTTINISNLTITNGRGGGKGGGVYNSSNNLNMTNVTFSNNSAFEGGGLYNDDYGNLILTDSTFFDNTATRGGGLFDRATTTMTNVTFNRNSADNGGAIYAGTGHSTLIHTTIAGNSAQYYGGGIYLTQHHKITFKNSILANNSSSPAHSRDFYCSAGIHPDSSGYNFIESWALCILTFQTSDIRNQDLLLYELADNGGYTQTLAPSPTSPVVNAIPNGVNGCGTEYITDQRGEPRPSVAGGSCDIGAVELPYTESPNLLVLGNQQIIRNGDTTPQSDDNTLFGSISINDASISHTFNIENFGASQLTFTGNPAITIIGENASDFSVTAQPSSPVAADGSTAFTVQFDPSGIGTRTATVRIGSDDPNKNPYTFDVQGTGRLLQVNTTDDVDDGACTMDHCSLREAIANALSGDEITFDVTGTITLTQGKLTIDKALTISGPGENQLTISGNHASQVFYAYESGTLHIRDLTIANAKTESDGGGLFYESTTRKLFVENVTFANNSAYQGGGLYNYSYAVLKNVTFSGNSSTYGGGMYNYLFNPTLTNVTFSGNSAYQGGGLYVSGKYNFLAPHTISRPVLTNVTISDNSASGSGGGIYSNDTGDPTLKNTILANNTAESNGPDWYCGYFAASSAGYNLIENTAGCVFTPKKSDITGQDPLLDALADNGGVTQTHALLPGSPAIDQIPEGANGCGDSLTEDQRGVSRPSPTQGACDIGAYEYLNREIDVFGNDVSILSGDSTPSDTDHTDFGIVAMGESLSRTFTIESNGMTDLNLTGIAPDLVVISGENAGDFNVTTQPLTPLAPGSSTTFMVEFAPSAGGIREATVSIANDDGDENLYTFTIQGSGDPPEMNILGNGVTISSGDNTPSDVDHTDFGSVPITESFSRTFTIENSGASNLKLIGTEPDLVVISGANAGDFNVTTQPMTPLAPGSSTTFTIEFAPTAESLSEVVVSIANNDDDENPYTFTIQGTGIPFEPPVVLTGDSSTYPAPNDIMMGVSITHLEIEFSKQLYDPDFSTDPDDVSNPANYLLIQKGINGRYDTVSCEEGLSGDDLQIPTGPVYYSGGSPSLATVTVNNGKALPIGDYQLIVCGTTSIVDENFIALAGDGVNAGTDFVLPFTIAKDQLPDTGFAPGYFTSLPTQPADKAYTDTTVLLNIPELEINIPVIGVPQTQDGWDVTWLGNNAGYLEGSAFPTREGNTVITGHVWNANNQPGVFSELKSLRYGEQIFIRAWGQTYVYEVRERQLLDPNDVDAMMESEEHDWLTLITCEFYNSFTGNYLFRRMIRAVLVEVR